MSQIPKSCEKTRDFFKKYFHLNSPAVYNSSAKNDNYEGAIWQISIGSKSFTLFRIYHPPKMQGMNSIFIDQLADELVLLQAENQNIIVIGDFNIHINDHSDADANYLIDAMSALGFDQLVSKATHRLGNTLDLIFTSTSSNIKMNTVLVSDLLSDHRLVVAQLNVGKPRQQQKEIVVRKVSESDIQALGKDFDCTRVMTCETTQDAVRCYNEECKNKWKNKLAEDFASFFLEKIQKIRDKFEGIPAYQPKHMAVPQLVKFPPFSQKEIKKLIMSMKTKSCELDVMPTNILKQIIDNCLPAVTKLVNLSLEQGFAEDWKTAIVRPLLKKIGLDLIFKNFRPVSNLSFISKLVEKVALDVFMKHCEDYKLMPPYQSAYRKDHSCETAVIKFMNDVLWGMENQKVTVCVLMDLSAAFDTVDHELLLDVLKKEYGVNGKALKWYDSYLRPRYFRVNVEGKLSDAKELNFSVPQGSASGANLFTAYCKSLGEVIPDGINIQGFADDHFLFKGIRPNVNEKTVITELEDTMHYVKTWMDAMRLKLNTDKTEFIYFGSQPQLRKCQCSTFKANDDIIEAVDSVRILGAFLGSNL